MALEFRDDPLMTTPELQGEVKRLVEQFDRGAIVSAIEGVSIGTAETPIAHGLGFAPRGASVTPYAAVACFRTRPADDKYVYFAAASAVVADVHLFP